MEKIHISFIKDLKNKQFFSLFIYLRELLDENKSDNATLNQAGERVKSHHDKLLLLQDTKLRHPLTEVINTKVRNRTEYLACLRMLIEAKLLSHIPEERVAATRLKLWMRAYKKDIHKPSIDIQGQLVKYLLHDREENADVKEYATLLNLDDLLDTIEHITTEIECLTLERIRDRNKRAVNGKEVRQASYKDFHLLINAIELGYSLSHDEEEKAQIAKLSRVINEHLKKLRTELKSRNTKRKNRKEIEEAVKELIEVEDKEDDNTLVIADNELHINETRKDNDSSPTQLTTSNTKIENKKVERDKKLNRENGSKGSSPTRIERDSDSEGDMKLPPL